VEEGFLLCWGQVVAAMGMRWETELGREGWDERELRCLKG
jgi:hypothetical protein